MDYARWIWLILYGTLVVSTMVTVLMDNRQPAKTLAWLLVLTFLPIVGLLLYVFFGHNHRKKQRIYHRRLPGTLTLTPIRAEQLPAHHSELAQQFANQGKSMPYPTSNIEIYTSGYAFFPALMEAFSKARHSIVLSTYIIDDDPLGRLIADALADQAARGIDVRLLYDDVGCWKVRNKFFKSMSRRGIHVEAFMPVHFPALTGKINYRNHRKLCVIDGETAFVGGMNIAKRYVKTWRDTHMRVSGPIAKVIEAVIAAPQDEDVLKHIDTTLPRPLPQGALTQFVTSSPLSPWQDIMQGYVRILLEAKHYVYMESPYFMPTEPIIVAMRSAVLAGIDVRLMVPRHSDAILVEWASTSYLAQAIEAGVQVYFYQDGFNHSKLLVSDDTLCTCGSTNIDFRSFENNFEANLFFYDSETAMRMKQVFLDDMQHCTLANEHVSRHPGRPFGRRLWESITRLLSPLL